MMRRHVGQRLVRLSPGEADLIHGYRECDAEHQAQIDWFVAAAAVSSRRRLPNNVVHLNIARNRRKRYSKY